MMMDPKERNILKSVDGGKTQNPFCCRQTGSVLHERVTICVYINTVVAVARWCAKSGACIAKYRCMNSSIAAVDLAAAATLLASFFRDCCGVKVHLCGILYCAAVSSILGRGSPGQQQRE